MKLLLVEDEKRMADALAELFRQENFDVDVCRNGNDGLDSALTGIYDVQILDVMLPGKSGFEIIHEVRKKGIRTPTLMLTAKSDVSDKVFGLDSGADDYLTKPFQTEELLARIRSLCRRSVPIQDGTLNFADLSLNPRTAVLSCRTSGQEIRLSDKEYRILECLMAAKGTIVSREQLVLKVWGYEDDSEYNNAEVYISFTRKKLTFIGSAAKIKAVRGLGYELREKDV